MPPTDRDEARFAQASRQMLESGDYVNIAFQDKTRHKKPVGIYWLQAASAAALGGAERAAIWAYRIPSLAGAIISVLATGWLGAMLFGRTAGLAAAFILSGTLLLGVESRLAKTDAMLLAAIVLAQAALGRIYLAWKGGEDPGWKPAMLFWAALGGGILLKGPVIFLPIGGTIVLLAILARRVRWLLALRPARGLVLLLLIVLPWFVAIGIESNWAFYRTALGGDFLAKLAKGMESHGAPPGFYLFAFWPTFWPFCLLAVFAVPWVWAHRSEPAVRYCIAWILPTWLVLELVATKLPHYILPVFPAIAILTAAAWMRGFAGGGAKLGKISRFVAVTGFVICSVIFAVLMSVGPYLLDGAVNIPGVLLGIVTLAVLVYGLIWWRRGAADAAAPVAGLMIGSFLFHGLLFQFFLPSLQTIWLSERIAAAVRDHRLCPGAPLAAAGFSEPSLVFLAGTKTKLGGGDTVARHLLADPACALGIVESRAMPLFLKALAKGGGKPEALARIDGVNYAKGKRLRLTLYRAAPGTP
ncbi:MAG: glycosyltransferase family 39 protein [Alphaproteobacteria bacterium]|nr:glycosyltransferase family 39 protein [Alphaproteobacteria bacterium]